jgi:group I intron endonuclease
MEKIYSIYKITNLVNGKGYIGFTSKKNPYNRWSDHIHKSRNYKQKRYPLHLAIEKYTKDNFIFEIICQSKELDYCLNALEPYFIIKYNTLSPNGYNIKTGGIAPIGYKHTKSTIEKMKKTQGSKKIRKSKSFFSKKMWETMSEEKRIIRSTKIQEAKKKDKEERSNKMKNIWKSEEYRKKQEKTRKKFMNEEYSKKQSVSQKKRWNNNSELKKKFSECNSKFWYEVTYPDGKIEITHTLKQFAKEHCLRRTGLYQVANGKQKTHMGFKVKKIGDYHV